MLASRLSDARRIATRGGQSVILQTGSSQIRISPLGICIAEKSGGGVHVDPFTCSIATVRAK